MHVFIHIHTNVHIYIYIYICIFVYILNYIYIYIYTLTYMYNIYTLTYMYTYSNKHTYTDTHTHTHMNIYSNKHTYTDTHTHTHISMYMLYTHIRWNLCFRVHMCLCCCIHGYYCHFVLSKAISHDTNVDTCCDFVTPDPTCISIYFVCLIYIRVWCFFFCVM